MKRVHIARHVFEAHHYRNLLAAAGIGVHVRNIFVGSAMGEMPVDHCAPEVWVNDARDATRAQQLLAELQQAVHDASWRCPACSEAIEGQFFNCWQCGAQRPD
jgi:rubrerythrin